MIDLSAVSLTEREASLSAFARVFTFSISEGGAASVDDAVPAAMVRCQSVATFWAIRRLIGPSVSPVLNRSGDNPVQERSTCRRHRHPYAGRAVAALVQRCSSIGNDGLVCGGARLFSELLMPGSIGIAEIPHHRRRHHLRCHHCNRSRCWGWDRPVGGEAQTRPIAAAAYRLSWEAHSRSQCCQPKHR